MRATVRLMQYGARLTLFTRKNCSLCDTAKDVISSLGKERGFEYSEIDVMGSGQKQWKDAYEFDTPVLHVERVSYTYSKKDLFSEPRKLMHRFSEQQVEALIDEAEGRL